MKVSSPRAIHSLEHFPRIALRSDKNVPITSRHVTSHFVKVNLFSDKKTAMILRITMGKFIAMIRNLIAVRNFSLIWGKKEGDFN